MNDKHLLHETADTAIYCFGGHPKVLPEVGRNCFVIFSENTRRSLVIEVGRQFQEPEEGGKEELTDFSVFRPYWERCAGVLATHIHLDHIGDLPRLYKQMPNKHRPPVIGSPFTVEFGMHLFDDFEYGIPPFFGIGGAQGSLTLGDFEVELIPTPHSTPQTRSFAVRCPRRTKDSKDTILFLSDFKMTDCSLTTGLGEGFRAKLRELNGKVDVMLFDALYCDEEGITPSEDATLPALETMLEMAPNNLILSCFASSTLRIENIFNRVAGKRAFLRRGRTMGKLLNFAQSCGWMDEASMETDPHTFFKHWVMMVTGCQAEEMAVLTRLSRGEGPFPVRSNYSFGLLANAIPENLPQIAAMIGRLLPQIPDGLFFIPTKLHEKLGISASNLIALENLHVSGHGRRGDHMEVLSLVKPKVWLPYHYPAEKQEYIDRYYR